MPTTGNDEVTRLEARVRELEVELRRERRRRGDEGMGEVADGYRDVSARKIDESARLLRGLVRGTLEAFRVGADSASCFMEDVLERNVPDRDESATDVARRLPGDVGREVVRALDRSLDIPGQAIGRFQRTYSEEEGGRTRPRAQRAEQVRRREKARARDSGQVEPKGEKLTYQDWSKTDLYERAQELDVEGRSDMSKEELIDAIQRREGEREG
jgi:Rho termination factor, N-terminal domain